MKDLDTNHMVENLESWGLMIRKKQGIHTAIEGYFREAIAPDIESVANKLRPEDTNTIRYQLNKTNNFQYN